MEMKWIVMILCAQCTLMTMFGRCFQFKLVWPIVFKWAQFPAPGWSFRSIRSICWYGSLRHETKTNDELWSDNNNAICILYSAAILLYLQPFFPELFPFHPFIHYRLSRWMLLQWKRTSVIFETWNEISMWTNLKLSKQKLIYEMPLDDWLVACRVRSMKCMKLQ